MTPISLSSISNSLREPTAPTPPSADGKMSVEEAKVLKQAFSQFVGETFFGSMLKSMRQSVGEPAYFHGGEAERQFQSRLDQQMAADMATGQGAMFADSLFEHQFPQVAAQLREAGRPLNATPTTPPTSNGLEGLDALRPR